MTQCKAVRVCCDTLDRVARCGRFRKLVGCRRGRGGAGGHPRADQGQPAVARRRSYTNKDVELAVLRTVYDVTKYDTVRHQDRPDFVLSYGGPSSFGVEITEIYQNESDARLQNIDGYLQELWDGKPHRHRDDIDVLKVGPVDFLDQDRNVKAKGIPAVMVNVTNMPTLPSLIAQRIHAKSAHFPEYVQGLTHVNLVIHDRVGDAAPKVDEVYESRAFLSDAVRSALNASSFNEVFLVSTDIDQNQVVRPLRALTLLETGYGFMQSMNSAASEIDEISDDDVYLLFIATCERLGLNLKFVRDEQDGTFAYFGGVGIQFGSQGMQIYDLNNFPPPAASEPPSFEMAAHDAMLLIEQNVEFFTDKVFSSAFGSPAVTPIVESINAINTQSDEEN
jgi:hypothetical protein